MVILVLLSVVFLAGLADLAWGIVVGLPVRRTDAAFMIGVEAARIPWVTLFMRLYTHLGDVVVAGIIVLAICAALWWKERKSYAIFVFGVTFSAVVVNSVLKVVVERTRPPAMFAAANVPVSASFPSGHTVLGVTLGGALAIIVLVEYGFRRGLFPAILLIAAGALLGISRVYLGVHWLSDVLGGWLLGMAWLCAWSAGWLWIVLRRKPERRTRQLIPPVPPDGIRR